MFAHRCCNWRSNLRKESKPSNGGACSQVTCSNTIREDDEVNLSSFKVNGKIYDTQDWEQQNALVMESLFEEGDNVSPVGGVGTKMGLVTSKSTSDNDLQHLQQDRRVVDV